MTHVSTTYQHIGAMPLVLLDGNLEDGGKAERPGRRAIGPGTQFTATPDELPEEQERTLLRSGVIKVLSRKEPAEAKAEAKKG